MLFKKVKANSLAITVVIALVIGLLCSSLIMLAYYNRRWDSFYHYEQKLDRNFSSAINIVLADTTDRARTDTFDLFEQGNDSVLIQRKYWGLFSIACVSAVADQRSKEKIFYYGASLPPFMDGCVYMAEHNRPLQLNGATILEGDAIISKAGLTPGYINQAGFNGTKLINGAVKVSKDSLPPINPGRITYLEQLLTSAKNVAGSSLESLGDSTSQSFKDSTLIIASSGKLVIAEKILQGNILVMSDSAIEIAADTRLQNIILVAPAITLKEGFQGSVQIIASRHIEIEKNCQLTYPSAVALVKPPEQIDPSLLTIGEDAQLQGVLFTWALSTDVRKTMVSFKKGSHIQGVAYVSGYAELAASIYGTIATDYFIHKSEAMLYENYLVNVELNRKKLFPFFVSSPLFSGYKNSKLLQWVH